MAEAFFNILTIIGQQKKASAEAGGAAVNITHFKVGDSNGTYYTPIETQTDLVHTTYTGNFTDNSGSQILVNPSALNEVLYKCFIPADIGGFTVRELGLFDAEDNLILICKLPAQDKFALESGLYQPLTFTPRIIYTNPATQAVLTPSSQLIATQIYVNEQLTDIKEQLIENITDHTNDPNAHSTLFIENSLGFKQYGCNISNNSNFPNSKIDISPGQFWNNDYTKKIVLNSQLTKTINALWQTGSECGALDTGTVSPSTDYFIWLISKIDKTTDILFSTSSSNPILPQDYTIKTLIGTFRTDVSCNIIPAIYFRNGNLLRVEYKALILEYSSTAPPATSTVLTLSAIPDLPNCRANLYCKLTSNINNGYRNSKMFLTDLQTNLEKQVLESNYDYYASQNMILNSHLINTLSKQIKHRYLTDSGSGATNYQIYSQAYEVIL